MSGNAPVLDDGIECTVDSCDEDNDEVVHDVVEACVCQEDSDCDVPCRVGHCEDDFTCTTRLAGAGSACNDRDVETCHDVCNGNGLCEGSLVCPDGMVAVPEGEFEMGSSNVLVEMPVRQVYLSLYYIDIYEVTVEQYTACVSTGDCSEPETGRFYNYGVSGRGRHPINGVDWDQAVAYCEAQGARLPTEAEWEKAARGTDGRQFPWGEENSTCQYAVMSDGGQNSVFGCGEERTWEVGSKPMGVSPYGAHDMAGNLWEWTADWFGEDYYASAPMRDPMGPTTSSKRVLRGGSWRETVYFLRAANRAASLPGNVMSHLGFRCAKTP